MAIFVGQIERSATPGEKQVFKLLTLLFRDDAEVHCYYEPLIGDERPDFVVLGPGFGVAIFEVKDYSERSLLEAPASGSWRIKKENEEKNVSNPFDQVYQYWRTISHRFDARLIQRLVVMSNISRASDWGVQIQAQKPSQIPVLFKEDIANFHDFQTKFNELVPSNCKITPEQFKVLRGNLIPTARLPTTKQTTLTSLILDADELKLLDKEQERMASNLGEGHRLFFGVAGSGKTVLLIARARYLAKRHPDWRILILCFNRLLARYIMQLLNPQDYQAEIEITNFHKWAKDIIRAAGTPYDILYSQEQQTFKNDPSTFFSQRVPGLLLKVIAETKPRQYDAILIDEAQDFEASWFKPVLQQLNPMTNSLLITCDGLQGIYARKKFHWSDVGVKAMGRVKKLQKSYRNPAEIGSAATKILPREILDLINTADEFLATTEYARVGGSIELALKEDRTTEYYYIIDKIKEFLEKDWSILVLFRKNMQNLNYNHPFLSMLRSNGLEWADLKEGGEFSSKLLVSTPQSAKGLESEAVIIPELDTYYRPNDRQLLYVGMTRALRALLLTADRETQLIRELNGAIK